MSDDAQRRWKQVVLGSRILLHSLWIAMVLSVVLQLGGNRIASLTAAIGSIGPGFGLMTILGLGVSASQVAGTVLIGRMPGSSGPLVGIVATGAAVQKLAGLLPVPLMVMAIIQVAATAAFLVGLGLLLMRLARSVESGSLRQSAMYLSGIGAVLVLLNVSTLLVDSLDALASISGFVMVVGLIFLFLYFSTLSQAVKAVRAKLLAIAASE